MFKLRQTWNEELAKSKLCDLDVKVKQLDPAWPIVMPQLTNNIHLNPKFLHNVCIYIVFPFCTTIYLSPNCFDRYTEVYATDNLMVT